MQNNPFYFIFVVSPYQNQTCPVIWPTLNQLQPVYCQNIQTQVIENTNIPTNQRLHNSRITEQPDSSEYIPQNSNPQPQPKYYENSSKRKVNKKQQTLIQSAKKNGQFNILNQALNFLDYNPSSKRLIDLIIKRVKGPLDFDTHERIRKIFFSIIRVINTKRARSYISCSIVGQYFTPKDFAKTIPNIENKLAETGLINLEELCQIFRIAVFRFIKTNTAVAVLTSRRIKSLCKMAHLEKRRSVIRSLSKIKSR